MSRRDALSALVEWASIEGNAKCFAKCLVPYEFKEEDHMLNRTETNPTDFPAPEWAPDRWTNIRRDYSHDDVLRLSGNRPEVVEGVPVGRLAVDGERLLPVDGALIAANDGLFKPLADTIRA